MSEKVCENDANMSENRCLKVSQNQQKTTKLEVKKKAEKNIKKTPKKSGQPPQVQGVVNHQET